MAQEPGNEGKRSSGWRRCPPGEFERLGQRVRLRRQRRLFLRTVSATAVVAAVGGGAWVWSRWLLPHEADFGGITCSEVQKLVQPYRHGALAPALREKIQRHLALCPMCGPAFRAMTS